MKKIISLLLLSMPFYSLHAADTEIFFNIHSFSHSEPMAIKSIGQDWQGRFEKGDIALSSNRINYGIRWNHWSVSALHRYDYLYNFSNDTARLLYLTENRINLSPGESFELQLSANSLEADGINIGYQNKISSISYGINLALLKGRKLIDGGLTGNAQIVANNDYNFLFDVDYLYTEDKLFDRISPAPKGNGFAIDINFKWNFNDQWEFDLNIKDLWSRIYWDQALRTTASADSDTKTFDSDGYVIFNPVASGLESAEDFTQALPRKIFYASTYQYSETTQLKINIDDYKLKTFYSVGIQKTLNNNSSVGLSINLTANAGQIFYNSKYLRFDLITDKLSLNKAKTFAIQAEIKIPLQFR